MYFSPWRTIYLATVVRGHLDLQILLGSSCEHAFAIVSFHLGAFQGEVLNDDEIRTTSSVKAEAAAENPNSALILL